LHLTALDTVKPILKAIQSITVCGGTDITCGLQSALEMFQRRKNDNADRQIILLTDGFGGCPTLVANTLKMEYQVTLDVIGIGGSRQEVNESLLKEIATTDANGVNHYRFIGNPQTLKQHYHQLATGLAWKGGR
jgi:Mg-chelatase subunit ChlD